jgi:iron complex transport system substrate-binding protein
MTIRRVVPAFALATALALSAAACGGSGSTDGKASPTTSGENSPGPGGESDATGTRTITHQYGATDVEGVPQRIVSLDPQFTDVLLALDVTPAAYVAQTTVGDNGVFPWQGDQLAAATQISYDGVGFENQDVFNATPDLIVGTYSIENAERYADLTDIAPTIAAPDADREVQRWQDLVTLAGQILDREDDAAELITRVEGEVADRAESLPDLEGKTYTFVNYVPGDALYVVADPEDGASELFGTLGLSINPEALGAADGKTGRAKFSLEQVDLLDSDLILMLANGGDPSDLIGFDGLRAAETGAVFNLSFEEAVALNTPSPLSVPWVLDRLAPALEKVSG